MSHQQQSPSNNPTSKESHELLAHKAMLMRLSQEIKEKEAELTKVKREMKRVTTAREDLARGKLLKELEKQEKEETRRKDLEEIRRQKAAGEIRRRQSVLQRVETQNSAQRLEQINTNQSTASQSVSQTLSRALSRAKATLSRTTRR